MSAQTVSTCVVCGAMTDMFLCGDSRMSVGCLGKLMRALGDVAALQGELDTVLARQNKTGGQSIGYVSNGGDEIPLPLNLKSTEVVTALRDTLCLWIRDLHETHAPRFEDGSVPQVDVDLNLISLSRWLMRHPTWIAVHPAADDLFNEVMEKLRDAWHAANFMAPDTAFYGLCYHVDEESGEECTAHLYGRSDAWTVPCKECGWEHKDLRHRQDQLDWAIEDQYVPMRDLVGLITGRGTRLTSSMVRGLAKRGKVTSWVAIPDGGVGCGVLNEYLVRVRVRTPDDLDLPALYLVSDVLDVIAAKPQPVAA